MTKPRVKICCISTIKEAKMAIERGASALGLVGFMPNSSLSNCNTLCHNFLTDKKKSGFIFTIGVVARYLSFSRNSDKSFTVSFF